MYHYVELIHPFNDTGTALSTEGIYLASAKIPVDGNIVEVLVYRESAPVNLLDHVYDILIAEVISGVVTIFANPDHRPSIIHGELDAEADGDAFPVAVTRGQTVSFNRRTGGGAAGYRPTAILVIDDGVSPIGGSIPTGGTANQALTKIDSTDFNTQWATINKSFVGLGNVDNTSNATERAAAATLLNKTLTSPVINSPTGIAKADVGLGNVDNTSNATERAATATLENKRIKPRVGTVATSATPTPDADAHDIFTVTALNAGAVFAAPTGTPTDGQPLMIRIKDDGTARTLGFNAIYRAVGVTLPTTTVISKTIYLGMIYNSADTKWDVIGYVIQA